MKQPKKLAAVLELNKQELKYLSCGIQELSRSYTAHHCGRDFDMEDLHDTVKKKLETALEALE